MTNDKIAALQDLIDVVAKLRLPDGGCPWDLAQTPETLIPYVTEEAYEVVDAIQSGDKNAIAEELAIYSYKLSYKHKLPQKWAILVWQKLPKALHKN